MPKSQLRQDHWLCISFRLLELQIAVSRINNLASWLDVCLSVLRIQFVKICQAPSKILLLSHYATCVLRLLFLKLCKHQHATKLGTSYIADEHVTCVLHHAVTRLDNAGHLDGSN